MSLSDVYRDRHTTPGWVYIQGSASERLLKFGVTINLRQRTGSNRTRKYGGIGDWRLLYRVWVEESGRVESDALKLLRRHAVRRSYLKDGRPQRTREMVDCAFSDALAALEQRLTESERASGWRSGDAVFYEFGTVSEDEDLVCRKDPRAPVGLPEGYIYFLPTAELELSVRSENCLANEGIVHLGSLVTRSEAELLRVPNFGRKPLNEIKAALAQLGLRLGTGIPDWPPPDLAELSERIGPLLKRVDELSLSIRTANCLEKEDLFYIGELVCYSACNIGSNAILVQPWIM
ncbi:MAG: DNA-directed polymerase subunit alpha [Tardiphaga sp.]|nr:DNA-directed polymerase subunit alpha [Tardiphaga sp.]